MTFYVAMLHQIIFTTFVVQLAVCHKLQWRSCVCQLFADDAKIYATLDDDVQLSEKLLKNGAVSGSW